jgi:putative transposase
VPRARRVVFAGDVVHVVARGVMQRPIYRDDRDRHRFVDNLRATIDDHRWRCLTYCLMSTHFHLVVQLEEPNLSVGMHALNGSYARWHNERHDRVGHLFERRYWSRPVTREEHMIGLARYVALNPVRAEVCVEAAQWPWSAHRALLGAAPAGFVDVAAMLAHFDEDLGRARRQYEAAVAAVEPSPSSATHLRLLEALASPDVDAAIVYAHRTLGVEVFEIARVLGWTIPRVRRRLERVGTETKGPDPFIDSAITKGARPLWAPS